MAKRDAKTVEQNSETKSLSDDPSKTILSHTYILETFGCHFILGKDRLNTLSL